MGRIISNANPSVTSMPFGNGVVRLFKNSGVFVVPSGVRKLRATVIGGGSGGLARCSGGGVIAYPNYGGSGGGFSSKVIDVLPGQAFTYIVGAGGVGRIVYASVNVIQSASAGGESSFGSVIRATGGGAPTVGTTQYSSGVVGAPGQGYGGDVNYAGGRSGIIQPSCISPTGSYFNDLHALGGGAAGHFYGDGGNGGDLYSIDNSNLAALQVIAAATGGGGAAGGNGGNIRGYAGSTNKAYASGGGGTGGGATTPASALYTSFDGGAKNYNYETFLGEDAASVGAIPAWHTLLPLLGGGQKSLYSSTSKSWVGSGAAARGGGTAGALALGDATAPIAAASALVIGGGGGALHLSAIDEMGATGGGGGYGGGGGAACAGAGLNIYIRAGNGGQGIVIVEF